MMKLGNVNVLAILSLVLVLSVGCAKSPETSDSTATVESFAVVIKASCGRPIAAGHLSLPTDMASRGHFSASCKIRVSKVPEKPSGQEDYAIRCLSQNNGLLSGTVRDGVVRIELHPQIDDNTVYLEGKLDKQSFKGKCFYQSYAGYENFATFEAQTEIENTP